MLIDSGFKRSITYLMLKFYSLWLLNMFSQINVMKSLLCMVKIIKQTARSEWCEFEYRLSMLSPSTHVH